MEREQTLRILNALANGVHPATGEQFAPDSPYQHPDTVRALYAAMRSVEGAAAAPARATADRGSAMPQSGAGSRWSTEEEERLAAAFDAGKSVDALAQSHGRTRAAIEARLVRLGKLDASAVTSPLRYPARPGGNQPERQGA